MIGRRFLGQPERDFITGFNFEVFKASGVVVGRKRPDNNARPYANNGSIREKAKLSYILWRWIQADIK